MRKSARLSERGRSSSMKEADSLTPWLSLGEVNPAQAIAEVAGIDDEQGRFERGLGTLLDGVEKQDHARVPPARPTTPRRAPSSGSRRLRS